MVSELNEWGDLDVINVIYCFRRIRYILLRVFLFWNLSTSAPLITEDILRCTVQPVFGTKTRRSCVSERPTNNGPSAVRKPSDRCGIIRLTEEYNIGHVCRTRVGVIPIHVSGHGELLSITWKIKSIHYRGRYHVHGQFTDVYGRGQGLTTGPYFRLSTRCKRSNDPISDRRNEVSMMLNARSARRVQPIKSARRIAQGTSLGGRTDELIITSTAPAWKLQYVSRVPRIDSTISRLTKSHDEYISRFDFWRRSFRDTRVQGSRVRRLERVRSPPSRPS